MTGPFEKVAKVENESTEPKASRDPDNASFLALHAEREALERGLSLAQQRQQFGTNAAEIERAGLDERTLLVSLDRVLTLIRAAEYRRQPGARRW